MNKSFNYLFIISFLMLVVGHFSTRMLGWYGNTFWADLCLHFISGVAIASGMLIVLARKRVQRSLGSPSPFFIFLFLILTATFLSCLWEAYEFTMFHFFPEYMQYSTALSDALSDIFTGTAGGILVGLSFLLQKRKR